MPIYSNLVICSLTTQVPGDLPALVPSLQVQYQEGQEDDGGHLDIQLPHRHPLVIPQQVSTGFCFCLLQAAVVFKTSYKLVMFIQNSTCTIKIGLTKLLLFLF